MKESNLYRGYQLEELIFSYVRTFNLGPIFPKGLLVLSEIYMPLNNIENL